MIQANGILSQIDRPSDLKALSQDELLKLACEIRALLIETVSKNGGHLASNLGVVELTIALLRVFRFPRDSVVFDVGHQCYPYKILTGRRDAFHTLRKKEGISGFPHPYESKYDTFSVGHSSTSLSAAIGLARAKLLSGDPSKVIVLIGDGAFAGGMVYEAMNSLDHSLTNLIVILNDNSMSISKSVGGISRYLLRLRTDAGYSNTKKKLHGMLQAAPEFVNDIADMLARSKTIFRQSIYDGRIFENFGFNYVGPVDGHNIRDLCRILHNLRGLDGPLLLHAITVKGKGFLRAEQNPGAYHGVGKIDLICGETAENETEKKETFSTVFGKKLASLGEEDPDICAVTAAMKYATGLNFFKKQFPARFFDVGIAEEHAVTFCAGLAKGKKKPVFAVYSTFLQRSYDQLFQDISLDQMDVLFAVDRAGFVGEDGETHQGLYDVALFSSLHGFYVVSPSNYAELTCLLDDLLRRSGPRAIRYPRGQEDARIKDLVPTGKPFDLFKAEHDASVLLIGYGRNIAELLDAQKLLKRRGIDADVMKLTVLLPVDPDALNAATHYRSVYFVEEGVRHGGLGSRFLSELVTRGFSGQYTVQAVDGIVQHATVYEQTAESRLDAQSVTETVVRGEQFVEAKT